MRKLVFICLCLFLLSGLFTPIYAEGHLTVLMYHRFDDGTSISTPTEDFKKQIHYLKENNYHFVSLDELIEHREHDRPFPDQSVMITVDDGFRSTYTKAYPFLKEEGIPWVLYIYTEAIEKGYNSALTWEQIREMSENGVTIQNHSYSHGKFIYDDLDEQWIQREIRAPHKLLKTKTGQESRSFAIPYGLYDQKLIKILHRETDYKVVFDIDPGVVDPTQDDLLVNRFGINRHTSWEDFLNKLNRLPLAVETTYPGPGARLSTTPDTMSVTLSEPEKFKRAPINVFVSEYDGPLEWEWAEDGRTIVVDIPRPAKKDWNRMIVTAYDREQGKYRYYSHGMVFE